MWKRGVSVDHDSLITYSVQLSFGLGFSWSFQSSNGKYHFPVIHKSENYCLHCKVFTKQTTSSLTKYFFPPLLSTGNGRSMGSPFELSKWFPNANSAYISAQGENFNACTIFQDYLTVNNLDKRASHHLKSVMHEDHSITAITQFHSYTSIIN